MGIDANLLVKYITFARRRISTRYRIFGTFSTFTHRSSVCILFIACEIVNTYGNYNVLANKKIPPDFNSILIVTLFLIYSLKFKKRAGLYNSSLSFAINEKDVNNGKENFIIYLFKNTRNALFSKLSAFIKTIIKFLLYLILFTIIYHNIIQVFYMASD